MSASAFAQPVATTGPKSAAAATSASSVASKSIVAAAENPAGSVSGLLNLSRSTSLYDFQDGTRQDSNDIDLKTSFQVTPNYSLSIRGGYSQDLHDPQASDFGDTTIAGNRRSVDIGKYTQIGGSVSVIVPTSKESKILTNLLSAFRLGVGIGLNPVVNPNLSLSTTLSIGQNFHAYETATNGKTLSKYAFNQSIAIGYSFGRFSLSGDFAHKNGWTYQGQLKESFEHSEELGAEINKNWAVAVGHTNKGSMLKANAVDSNLDLINENSSIVYGSVTYLF